MFLGLRSVIYAAPDLAASKAYFSAVLGVEPYFAEPFYVGYAVAGYELGLDPDGDPADSPRTYWGVADAAVALAALVERGAPVQDEVSEVGGGIRMATVREPGGAVVGVIENPHYSAVAITSDGPGR